MSDRPNWILKQISEPDDEDAQREMDDEALREMIRELCEVESGLSQWEVDFVEEMSHRDTFTARQAAKIEELFDKYC